MALAVRVAKAKDFRDFFERKPPKVWNALCCVRDGRIIGMGGVVYTDDGVAMGFLDMRERPAVALHRAGLRFMAAMKAVGEPVIYTACDDAIPRAADWLLRLGFKMTPDVVEGQRLWRWKPE